MPHPTPATLAARDEAAWLLSRPWSLPAWQRRICLALCGGVARKPAAQPWLPLWGA